MPWLGLGVPALAGAGGTSTVIGTSTVVGTSAAVGTGVTASSATTAIVGGAALAGVLSLSGDTPQHSAATAVPALTPEQLADRLKKVQDRAAETAATAAASCATGNCCQRTIVIPYSQAPESAQHIDDAQRAGFPSVLTYGGNSAAAKSAARARRRSSTSGLPRSPGTEPDEYPPAAFLENAGAASVRNIDWRDNRVSGGIIGANLVGVPPGCRVTIVTGP